MGASFNVLVSSADETTITHIASPENIDGHRSRIDDSRINGNPNALVTVTHNCTPYLEWNNHSIGVEYSGGWWHVFLQDGAPISENAAFNILIPPTESAAFVHVATAENSEANHTYLDHPLLNGNPNAIALVTQNVNPGAVYMGANNHQIGLWYSDWHEKWSVFNQDVADMPDPAAFNVFVPPAGANTFTQVTTEDNRENQSTFIDHPLTNQNPSRNALFTPNWNPAGLPGQDNDHATGIWFHNARQQSAIHNEDLAEMPLEAAFNVHIPDDDAILIVHTTTTENTYYLNFSRIDHPDLNGNPYALVYVTHNYNPGGGLGGEYYDQGLGVFYSQLFDQWSVFNQDLDVDLPIGVSFNVLVIPNTAKCYLPLIQR
jgi:hypothetical protein